MEEHYIKRVIGNNGNRTFCKNMLDLLYLLSWSIKLKVRPNKATDCRCLDALKYIPGKGILRYFTQQRLKMFQH